MAVRNPASPPSPPPPSDTDRLAALEAHVRELTHDLAALATLAGQHFGEPFRSTAQEIVTKRQTGNGRKP